MPARKPASPSQRSMSASSISRAMCRRMRWAISSGNGSSRRKSATSTAISSTACRARAARSARAATRTARSSKDRRRRRSRWRCSRASCASRRTAPPKRTSTSPPSTARRGSWRSPGRRTASAAPSPTRSSATRSCSRARLPRFLSVGDRSRFHIQVDNVEGPAGEYAVDLDIRGPIIVPADALRSTLRLESEGRGALTIPVTAAGPGTAIIDAKLSGGGFAGAQSFAVAHPAG